MFCPFAKTECREDCVFHCVHKETLSELTQSSTNCLIVKRLYSLNYMQFSQIEEIKEILSNKE